MYKMGTANPKTVMRLNNNTCNNTNIANNKISLSMEIAFI